MRYMALPVSFRWAEEFVARVDAARGDVPRSRFVQRAVEAALEGSKQLMEPRSPVVADSQPRDVPARTLSKRAQPRPIVQKR